jgi:glutaredoxin-related protein
VKAELEVKANKINYVRVMRKVCNQRQVLDVDGQVFEEVRMFKYLGVLLRGNKLNY